MPVLRFLNRPRAVVDLGIPLASWVRCGHDPRLGGPAVPGALDGVRILDFTRYQQGPFATVLLSDLGADVIKVEEPTNGDLGRSLGLQPDGWCAYFQALNRNKRSLTIDTRTPRGARSSTSWSRTPMSLRTTSAPARWSASGSITTPSPRSTPASSPPVRRASGPRARTRTSPRSTRLGQAMGGIMVAQGGGPGAVPATVIGGMADQVGAMIFALGISSALVARELHGVGQHVDTSLLGSQLALQGLGLTGFLRTRAQGPSAPRWNPLFTFYPCGDGLT